MLYERSVIKLGQDQSRNCYFEGYGYVMKKQEENREDSDNTFLENIL